MTDLKSLLILATADELASLAKIVGAEDPVPKAIAERLQKASRSVVKSKVLKSRPSYAQIVEETASNLGIKPSNRSTELLEREVKLCVRKAALKGMTPEQRQRAEEQCTQFYTVKPDWQLMSVAAEGTGVLVAKASGFGVYQLRPQR